MGKKIAMTIINITDEAHRAIRSRAEGEFTQTGTRRADGSWDVPLAEDVIERIESVQLQGETLSDVILRLSHTAGRHLS